MVLCGVVLWVPSWLSLSRGAYSCVVELTRLSIPPCYIISPVYEWALRFLPCGFCAHLKDHLSRKKTTWWIKYLWFGGTLLLHSQLCWNIFKKISNQFYVLLLQISLYINEIWIKWMVKYIKLFMNMKK